MRVRGMKNRTDRTPVAFGLNIGMCAGGERNGLDGVSRDTGRKIHPLGQRTWEEVKIPRRVWWTPGQAPERNEEIEALMEENPLLRIAHEVVEKGAKKSRKDMENALIADWLEARFGYSEWRKIAVVGLLAWIWYSFQSESIRALSVIFPVQVTAFGFVAVIGGFGLLLLSLIVQPKMTDAVRRVLFLYIACLIGFPIGGMLGAAGSADGAIYMFALSTAMCIGSLWFWRDMNTELNAATYADGVSKWFCRWRYLFTSLAATSVAMYCFLFRSIRELLIDYYRRGLQLFLKYSSPQLGLFSDPGALMTVGFVLAVAYSLYSAVYFAFVTDVGRYPFARAISTPFNLMLRKKNILTEPEMPDPKIKLSHPKGEMPPEYIQKIGNPDRPEEKENLPDMEYPWVFRQLEKLEQDGQFQGMYSSTVKSSSSMSSMLENWAVYAEIPEDESIQDRAELVNPAKVSEDRIQAIMNEASQKLSQSKEKKENRGFETPLYTPPDDDGVEWLFMDPDSKDDDGAHLA